MQSIGFLCQVSDFRAVNMVGNCDFKNALDLEHLSKMFRYHFNPELFPGLSVTLNDFTAVIFRTGKCNLLGAKSFLDIQGAFIDLFMQLSWLEFVGQIFQEISGW